MWRVAGTSRMCSEITSQVSKKSALPRAVAYPYHLLYRLKRFIPNGLLDAARKLDHAALTLAPSLRHHAGAVVIQLVK